MSRVSLLDRKSVYFFDLDGTLIDSIPSFVEAACDVITKYWPHISKEEARYMYTSTLGMPFKEQMAQYSLSSNKAFREWDDVNRNISVNAPLFDGVLQFMEAAEDKTHLAIISSNLTEVVNKVVNKHFPYLVDWASGCEYGSKAQQIDRFCERYFITDLSATYFGDTEHDRQIANDIGMRFVLIEGVESWKALIGSHS